MAPTLTFGLSPLFSLVFSLPFSSNLGLAALPSVNPLGSALMGVAWLVPLYALVGAALALVWSPGITRRTGPRPAGYLNLLMTFLAFAHSILALISAWGQPALNLSWSWLQAAGLQVTIDLKVSAVTLGAMALVTGLNLLAQLYAVAYLEMDWGWARFYTVLGLFEAGMCSLVLCNSVFFSYFILEILTLCTYLLIGIWYNQSLVVTGARDAFLTKRIGDLILLVGVVALLPLAGSWNYDDLTTWAASDLSTPAVLTGISLTLIAGPLGKCAQFPLHLWLDEAQEGPLPATILRNSVVVATGAWVLIQLEPVLACVPLAQTVMIAVGSATAFGAVCISIAQVDIKRVLSYLVSAFMGLVFIAIGTGQTQLALLFLLTYALAMALLVMAIGTIILSNITQDLTQLGGLWPKRPIPGLAFLLGTVSLAALPPFGNFWPLARLVQAILPLDPKLAALVVVVNCLTAFSLMRVFMQVWGGSPTEMTARSPEVLWPMVVPLTLMVGFNLHTPILLYQWQLIPADLSLGAMSTLVLVLSTGLGLVAGAGVYAWSGIPKPVRLPVPQVQEFFAKDFYAADLYRYTIVAIVGLSSKAISLIDRYLVDGLVNLVGLATMLLGQGLKYNISGQVQSYALTIAVALVTIGFLILWPLLQLPGLDDISLVSSLFPSS
ncbi:MAG: NAD(P)H-quinone oxidoreductase subunit F [Prochlorothrix sp.]|nr:NAD(P)H-quinone oxidoreductase subunit F [Prochlorothrix sp.]